MKKILVLNFSVGLIVLLTGLFVASTSYADRIVHTTSGKCAHPNDISLDYKIITELMLHTKNCSKPDSNLEFVYENSRIIHTASGKCVEAVIIPGLGGNSPPSDSSNPQSHLDAITQSFIKNLGLALEAGCDDQHSIFTLTSDNKIKLDRYGSCAYPKGGAKVPGNYTELILGIDVCERESSQFSLEPLPVIETITTKLYHSNSGVCVQPKGRSNSPKNNTQLVFDSWSCGAALDSLYFTMNSNGSIKHISSGKCIHPKGGKINPSNNTKLVLHDGCSKLAVQFKKLSNGAIQHKISNKCIHPKGGSENPKSNTQLVLYNGCNENKKLSLSFN